MVDGFVLVPLYLPTLFSPFWTLDSFWQVVLGGMTEFVCIAYFVGMHAKYGQTLGKRVARVRVVSTLDETPIGWAAALRRERPWLIFVPLAVVYDLTWITGDANGDAGTQLPYAPDPMMTIYYMWLAADIGCALVNKKRRSLHDYIGGTVVVRTT